ncbi:MAG: YdjY domain-containing protein [Gammaproteobacteria bacterium]|nr:YdjY domain-containing protein [Gammaproteobacteria bacterium]
MMRMSKHVLIIVVVVASVVATKVLTAAETPAEPPKAKHLPPAAPHIDVQDLGNDRFRIAGIMIDKAERRFTVPGRIAHRSDPLEYLAVSIGGVKEYESLLELLATATQFQLASILIGLDDANSVKPRFQFDDRQAIGQRVAIDISWEIDGKTTTVKASNALLAGGKPLDSDDWVYIGSITEENGQFVAESVGSLIGFVHDPFAIIEHKDGLGIGAYGNITGNTTLLPPDGAPVTVSVSLIMEKSGEEQPKKIAKE